MYMGKNDTLIVKIRRFLLWKIESRGNAWVVADFVMPHLLWLVGGICWFLGDVFGDDVSYCHGCLYNMSECNGIHLIGLLGYANMNIVIIKKK